MKERKIAVVYVLVSLWTCSSLAMKAWTWLTNSSISITGNIVSCGKLTTSPLAASNFLIILKTNDQATFKNVTITESDSPADKKVIKACFFVSLVWIGNDMDVTEKDLWLQDDISQYCQYLLRLLVRESCWDSRLLEVLSNTCFNMCIYTLCKAR